MLDLKRIFTLINKTKDKFVVHDEMLGDFAVLTLEDYERLVGVSTVAESVSQKQGKKQQKVKKNEENVAEDFEAPDAMDDIDEFDEKLAEKDTDDHYYFEPVDEEK